MFRANKDTNTGVVYDWVKKQEDGSEVWVNVSAEYWKREQDWTREEIENLFSGAVNDQITDSAVTEEPVPSEPTLL